MKLRALAILMAVAFAAGSTELLMLGARPAAAMDWLTPHLESQRFNNNLRRRQQQMKRKAAPRYQSGRAATSPGPDPVRRQQLMREIEPEYWRRVRAHGKASADRWLKRTAYQLGVEEGRRARRQLQ